jgi:TetR/AcrR family transcriptional regulator, regulator of autoinduction and epiphytic fitness
MAPAARPVRSAAPEDDPAAAGDGRHARSARSREAVVEAMLDLLNEGESRPTADQISARSGVSVRSIFRHFDDLESLYATAITMHLERVGPLFLLPPSSGSLEERVRDLVQRRAELFETITPVRAAAERVRGSSQVIDDRLEVARRTLRKQLKVMFEPELASTAEEGRADLLDALELATSWRAWNTLRAEQGCSRRRATSVVETTVLSLLR